MIRADLVVTNATIHTMNPEQPSATWFAVIGGDVVAVGDGDDVPPLKKLLTLASCGLFQAFTTHTVTRYGLGCLWRNLTAPPSPLSMPSI